MPISDVKIEYYVLKRGKERKVVVIHPGNDPLYGNGSWDLDKGPYSTIEDAENAMYYLGNISNLGNAV